MTFETVVTLGQGGMGIVYLVQAEDGTMRARKTMAPKLQLDPENIVLFHKEIEIYQRCSGHPGLPEYLGEGILNDVPYFDIEYIEGKRLDMLVPEGKESTLPLGSRLLVLEEIAAALEHVHGLGFIHRDICPANVLVGLNGQSYLTDFGVADSSPSYPDGKVIGKLRYNSPQAWRLEPVDTRHDIFAFGCMSYLLCTQAHPFGKLTNLVGMQNKILRGQVALPQSINPEIPDQLQDVILRCLEPSLSERYQSISEVKEGLNELLTLDLV